MVQFMWLASIRTAPLHSKGFLNAEKKSGYLTILFLSIELCRSFYPLGNYENNINRNMIYQLIGLQPTIDSTIHSALVLTNEIDTRFIFNANSEYLDLKRAHRKNKKVFDLLLEDAMLLLTSRYDELNNDIEWYGVAWKEWLNVLSESGGGYWADWYVRLFENRFRITSVDEINRHLSLPKELWNKELSVSAQWLMKLTQKSAKHLNEARIILLGEKGAGKTSLARRLIDPNAPMPTKEESTEGVIVSTVKLSEMAQGIPAEIDSNVHIWDFAGHAITHAAHRFFLSERCLYIIIYDGRTEGRNRLSYWLDHVRNYGGKSRVIVLVNQQDGHNPDIAETYFRERYLDQQCRFVRFSIKDDEDSLKRFRQTIAEIISADPVWDQKMPADYHDVKEQIEKEFSKRHKNHITREEFDKIAINVTEKEREILLKSLSCLGICLWYPDIKEIDLLVLNPEWITHGIYRIINWLREKGCPDASIKLDEFVQVFSAIEEEYPKSKHQFLYQLMQNYELAYEKAFRKEKEIVIPQCLPEDRPTRTKLPDFPHETSLYVEITACKTGNEGPRLMFPPDVLPRFIVRRSDDLQESLLWRYGAVLKQGNVIALIEQDDFIIQLRVKGEESRDYMGELLYTLMTVLNDYPSFALEKPEVSCFIIGRDKGPREMMPLPHIVNLVQHMIKKNETSYVDYTRNMEISLDSAIKYLSPKLDDYLITENGLERIIERVKNMLKEDSNKTINVIANQANITTGKGTINATQNNGISTDEVMRLISNLKASIPPEASEDDKKTINESVEAIEEEFKNKKPRRSVVTALLNGLKAIKGSAEFAAAVAAIIQFVQGAN